MRALAFIFASTNLVIELGAVLWILMGWQFVVTEISGAFVLITLMWLLINLFLPQTIEREIKRRAALKTSEANDCQHDHAHDSVQNIAQWSRPRQHVHACN